MIFGASKKHLENNIRVQYMFSSPCSVLKSFDQWLCRQARNRRPTPPYQCLQAPALWNTETVTFIYSLSSNPAVLPVTHTIVYRPLGREGAAFLERQLEPRLQP